jgi:hypothetical protein
MYPKDLYLKSIILLTILILYASGCGQDSALIDDPTIPLGIEFHPAPGAALQTNLSRIELTVSVPDMDEPLIFPITDINSETRTARGSIRVPVGSGISFFVRAFEGDCPALSGLLENVEITPDRTAPISIRLDIIQIIIGVRSQQDQLSVGSDYVVEVYIEDTPRLFAFTCELEFDNNLLQPVEIVPGDFFGASDDFLFVEDSQLPRNQQNRLSLGITRKGSDPGVCGSGTVFRVSLRAASPGNAAVRLLQNDLLTLTDPDHEMIDDSRIRIVSSVLINIQ